MTDNTEEDSTAPAEESKHVPAAPKGTRKAEPKPKDPSAPGAVVSPHSDTDPVRHAQAIYESKHSRKSLTVHHLQRRLTDLGYAEAAADRDGWYSAYTALAVTNWQKDKGYEETGLITRDQFAEVFDGDVNVEVILDTIG